MKTYWPYLPMLGIIGIGLLVNQLWGSPNHNGVLGLATDVSITELLNDTNAQREANGLPDLNLNTDLDNAAQAKANDMVTQNYWAHVNPQGVEPWTFITNSGYDYQAAGENLAYGFDDSADTVTGWMNSPDHRANILDTSYTDVGFGFANSTNFVGTGPETVVVAEYAEPAAAPAPVAAPATTTPKPTTTTPSASTTPVTSPTASLAPTTTATPAPTSTPTSTPTQSVVAVSKPVTPSESIKIASIPEPPSRDVSRIQLVTSGNATWSLFAVSSIASIGVCLIVLRHARKWQKVVVRGEEFVINHAFLDIFLVSVVVVSVLLTRTGGVIR